MRIKHYFKLCLFALWSRGISNKLVFFLKYINESDPFIYFLHLGSKTAIKTQMFLLQENTAIVRKWAVLCNIRNGVTSVTQKNHSKTSCFLLLLCLQYQVKFPARVTNVNALIKNWLNTFYSTIVTERIWRHIVTTTRK